MTSMKRLSLVALLVTSFAAAAAPSYAVAEPQPVKPFVPGINEDPALSTAWQQWQAKDIHDYAITVRISCFCPRSLPVRTVIRDDRTVRVTQGDRRLRPGRGYSMDEVFGLVRDAQATADDVTVDFTRRGVPTSIVVDRIKDATDDELYYSVSLSRL
jgi:ribosomal protein L13E